MSSNTEQTFGKWRGLLWPIHSYELKKIIPMLLMFFCISFNYTILRDTKDTLIVVTAKGSGAETIAFLKVWAVVPMAILFMFIYAKLANVLSREKLFYVTLTPFLIFFALFALFLYPLREMLHPHEATQVWFDSLPESLKGLKGLIAIVGNWTFSLFYVLAELWGSVVLSLLFWQFANQITRVSEAKRFYTLFGVGANIALMVSGPTIMYFSKVRGNLPAGVDPWGYSLNWLMALVVISGVLIMVIYRWMNKNVLTDERFYNPDEVKQSKKKKPKMSMGDSFRYIFSSKYVGCLALLVIGYGICINLVEISWKSQLKLQFPDSNSYSYFMGQFSTVTGIVTVFMMLFIGGNVIRRFGWGKAALVTPIILMITGTAFFGFVIFKDNLLGLVMAFGTSPLMFAVIFGAAQNIFSKSCKYSMFDPTKEMAYIPLDSELKVKGKAAVDVLGARLGKSGGALMNQGLILMAGGIAYIAPYAAILMLIFGVVWIFAAKALNKQFVALTAKREEEEELPEAVAENNREAQQQTGASLGTKSSVDRAS